MDKVKVTKFALATAAGFGVDAVVAGVFGTFGAGAIPIVRKVCVPAARVVTSFAIQDRVIRPHSEELVDNVIALAKGEARMENPFED